MNSFLPMELLLTFRVLDMLSRRRDRLAGYKAEAAAADSRPGYGEGLTVMAMIGSFLDSVACELGHPAGTAGPAGHSLVPGHGSQPWGRTGPVGQVGD